MIGRTGRRSCVLLHYGDLLDRVRSSTLIAIDGVNGARKTTLGRALAGDLGCEDVELDCLLDPKKDPALPYWERVDLNRLEERLRAAGGRAVVEGVCMRKVLGRLLPVPDALHVYVRITQGDPSFVEPVAAYELGNRYLPKSRLVRDVAEYHESCKPWGRADFVYVWDSGPR